LAFLITQTLTGLASASSLFLVAAGLTVIFGVTRVVNFAHGSLCMLGAFIGWSVLTRLPRDPAWFAFGVLLTMSATGLIGVVLEVSLLRRIYRAPELFQLLATFGVVLVLQDATLFVWGPNDLPLPRPPWLRQFVVIADSRFPLFDLVLIAIGPLVLGALLLVFHHTRWGVLVRAATQDRDMVSALGVDQRMLFTSVFALGAGLAGLGGVLALPAGSANLQIDLAVITEAFVVVVVGGLGSIGGAYLAALLIGVLQAFGVVVLPGATLVLVFVVMAAVLVVRPHGLLGRDLSDSRSDADAITLQRPAGRWQIGLAIAGLAMVLAVPYLFGPFGVAIATEMLVAALFASSLHVMMGPGGMPSFGHAAWFGIGAYGAALLAHSVAMPLALAAAPILAGLAAAAVGAFIVRLSGVYLAMLTLAFAQIVWAVAVQFVGLTGGDNGVLGVWPADPRTFYYLAVAVCVGGILVLRRVLFSPFGFALRAGRDAPARAAASGMNVGALRLAAFTLAGAAAGLAGGIFTYAKGSAFPTYISVSHSVDALIMVLLGGIGSLAGPIIGAVAYTGLFDLLLASDFWRARLGAVIIALVLFFPAGIAGWRRR
jgi:branched-chain amino acid transport system permease protein